MTDTTHNINARYLIRKYGGYYRPNSQGYTGSAIQAGRYTLAEAIQITHPNGPDGPRDGMTFIHEDSALDEDWTAYTALQAERDAWKARAEAAEAALKAIKKKTSGQERATWSRIGHRLGEASWYVHLAGFRSRGEAHEAMTALLALTPPADLAKGVE